MSQGATLELLARDWEALVSKELRFHPDVADDERFVFTEEKRTLKKAVGELPAGSEVECYSVELRKEAFF